MKARASEALCEFVRENAPPFVVSDEAPETWPALRKWFLASRTYKAGEETTVFHVSGVGCEWTIYPDAETNHAFRAWHDSIHCYHGLGFNLEGEIRVGLIHMQQARKAGLSKLDQDMLIADTIGQIQYYNERDTYVVDQALFVGAVLKFGLRNVLDSGGTY